MINLWCVNNCFERFTPYFTQTNAFCSCLCKVVCKAPNTDRLSLYTQTCMDFYFWSGRVVRKMKINKTNALHLWNQSFGNAEYVEDFHGNLMCRNAYGDKKYFITDHKKRIYCGWNVHHILPVSHGWLFRPNNRTNPLQGKHQFASMTAPIRNEERSDSRPERTCWIRPSKKAVPRFRTGGKTQPPP